MKTYRAAMTALGLSRGQEFTSDDSSWDKFVDKGVLTIVFIHNGELTVVHEEPQEQQGGDDNGKILGELGETADVGGEKNHNPPRRRNRVSREGGSS